MFNLRKVAVLSVSSMLLAQAVCAAEENGNSGSGANSVSSYTDGTYPENASADMLSIQGAVVAKKISIPINPATGKPFTQQQWAAIQQINFNYNWFGGGQPNNRLGNAAIAFNRALAKASDPLPNTCFDRWWLTSDHEWQWENNNGEWSASLNALALAQYGDESKACEKALKVDQLKLTAETVAQESAYEFYPKLKVAEKVLNESSLSVEASKQVASQDLPSNGACGGVVKTAATLNGITWQATATSGCYGENGVR